MSRVTGRNPAPVTWETVAEPRAKGASDALADLQRKGGPPYVNVSAAELAALMVKSTGHRLPAALDSVQAAVDSESVRVKALVKLDDVRGLDALGPLAGLLNEHERSECTRPMSGLRPGRG